MSGSDERAREVEQAVQRIQMWMNDEHRTLPPGKVGAELAYDDVTTVLRAALAASRPTDAGAGDNSNMIEILQQFHRNMTTKFDPASMYGADFDKRMMNNAAKLVANLPAVIAALATPKPPVDEEARWPIERPASADIDVSGTAAIGISAADINSADDWLVRNLTGDGAGA